MNSIQYDSSSPMRVFNASNPIGIRNDVMIGSSTWIMAMLWLYNGGVVGTGRGVNNMLVGVFMWWL